MAAWQNTRTGVIHEMPDEPPEGAPRAEAAQHRRMIDALDRSARWQRLDPPPAVEDDDGREDERQDGEDTPPGDERQGEDEEPGNEDDDGAGKDPADMTVVQLRELAKERGVSTSGSKAELIERLTS